MKLPEMLAHKNGDIVSDFLASIQYEYPDFFSKVVKALELYETSTSVEIVTDVLGGVARELVFDSIKSEGVEPTFPSAGEMPWARTAVELYDYNIINMVVGAGHKAQQDNQKRLAFMPGTLKDRLKAWIFKKTFLGYAASKFQMGLDLSVKEDFQAFISCLMVSAILIDTLKDEIKPIGE